MKIFAPRIRASWALVLKRVSWEVLGRRLYETIFEEAPHLESMFDRSAVAMGIKLIDMIDSMVGALDDMPAVHRKVESLGGIHHRHGVHALEHMPVFKGVVIKLLAEALGADLNDDVGEAWEWLWGWLTESMLVVERAYGEKASLIQQSWDAVNERLTVEQIGGAVYEALFEVRGRARLSGRSAAQAAGAHIQLVEAAAGVRIRAPRGGWSASLGLVRVARSACVCVSGERGGEVGGACGWRSLCRRWRGGRPLPLLAPADLRDKCPHLGRGEPRG